jgi:hypothetical protein
MSTHRSTVRSTSSQPFGILSAQSKRKSRWSRPLATQTNCTSLTNHPPLLDRARRWSSSSRIVSSALNVSGPRPVKRCSSRSPAERFKRKKKYTPDMLWAHPGSCKTPVPSSLETLCHESYDPEDLDCPSLRVVLARYGVSALSALTKGQLLSLFYYAFRGIPCVPFK